MRHIEWASEAERPTQKERERQRDRARERVMEGRWDGGRGVKLIAVGH